MYIAKDGRHIPILIDASLIDSPSGRIELAAFRHEPHRTKGEQRDSLLVRLDDATRPLLLPVDLL